MNRKLVPILFALALGPLSGTASAYDEWRRGAAVLPKYCQDRVDWASPNSRWPRWAGYFGGAAIHMSHYCNGMFAELMAKRETDARKRNLYLAQTIDEMAYVSPSCDPKCVIYADLHRRWAWALLQQGKIVEAMKHTRLAESAPPAPPLPVH